MLPRPKTSEEIYLELTIRNLQGILEEHERDRTPIELIIKRLILDAEKKLGYSVK